MLKIVINFFLLFKANFTIYVDSNLNACPKENSVNITIFPEGLEDRVQIMLDYNCECDCQREPEAVSLNLSICPSVCLSVCLSLSLYLSIYQSIYLSIYQSINLSIYLSIYISIYLSRRWCNGAFAPQAL